MGFFCFFVFLLVQGFLPEGKGWMREIQKISLLGKYIKSPWAKVIWNESYPSGLKLYQRQNYFFLPSFSLMYVSYSCLKTVTQGRPCFQGERDRTRHLGQCGEEATEAKSYPVGPLQIHVRGVRRSGDVGLGWWRCEGRKSSIGERISSR